MALGPRGTTLRADSTELCVDITVGISPSYDGPHVLVLSPTLLARALARAATRERFERAGSVCLSRFEMRVSGKDWAIRVLHADELPDTAAGILRENVSPPQPLGCAARFVPSYAFALCAKERMAKLMSASRIVVIHGTEQHLPLFRRDVSSGTLVREAYSFVTRDVVAKIADVIEVASPSRLDAIPTDEALSLLCGGVEMWPLGPTSFFERVFGKTVPAPSITLSAVFVSPLEGQSARDACQG